MEFAGILTQEFSVKIGLISSEGLAIELIRGGYEIEIDGKNQSKTRKLHGFGSRLRAVGFRSICRSRKLDCNTPVSSLTFNGDLWVLHHALLKS